MKRDSNHTATYDPRTLWAANVAPYIVAAREGAAHAARTADRERARVRVRNRAWWRRRWVLATAVGLAVAGAAGGVLAALAKGRTELPGGVRSTMGAGREKMTGAARTVRDKMRDQAATNRKGALTTARPDESSGEVPTTGSGYPRR